MFILVCLPFFLWSSNDTMRTRSSNVSLETTINSIGLKQSETNEISSKAIERKTQLLSSMFKALFFFGRGGGGQNAWQKLSPNFNNEPPSKLHGNYTRQHFDRIIIIWFVKKKEKKKRQNHSENPSLHKPNDESIFDFFASHYVHWHWE